MRYAITFITYGLDQVIGSRLSKSYVEWDGDLEMLPLMGDIVIGVSICTKS